MHYVNRYELSNRSKFSESRLIPEQYYVVEEAKVDSLFDSSVQISQKTCRKEILVSTYDFFSLSE